MKTRGLIAGLLLVALGLALGLAASHRAAPRPARPLGGQLPPLPPRVLRTAAAQQPKLVREVR